MRDLNEEPALLAALAPLVARADGLVTYNGSGFDVPLLETRFVLARRRWPDLWHLDLLAPARRVWGARFADCRLTTLEAGVLGLERTNDVPGAMIPALYFDFLRRRQPGALPRAWEGLARLHARRRGDFAAARRVVLEAIERAERAGTAARARRELGHRLARLERRLAAAR